MFNNPDFYTFLPSGTKPETEISKTFHFGFEEESFAQNFIQSLNLKCMRFFLSIYKIHHNHDRGELAIVPKLDWSVSWTEDMIKNELKLTEEELEFIFKNIPDVKNECIKRN